jgi:serine/threonine kinase 32
VVGKGAFGKVRIVEKKDTGLTFALKYIRKEEGGSFDRLILLLVQRTNYLLHFL